MGLDIVCLFLPFYFDTKHSLFHLFEVGLLGSEFLDHLLVGTTSQIVFCILFFDGFLIPNNASISSMF